MYYRIASDSWLFVAPKPEEIKIFCAHKIDDVINLVLNNTGIIEIKDNCTIIGKVSLTPYKIERINYNVSILSHLSKV
jgi:hypothetical protein